MTSTLQDMLHPEALTEVVEEFNEQSREHDVSALFVAAGRQIYPAGKVAHWDEVPFHRGLAPVVGSDSPHPQVQRLQPRKCQCVMVTIKAYKDLPGGSLFLQRGLGARIPDAEEEIRRETKDLAQIIANTREYLSVGALLGRIEVSEQTIPGSELQFTIEFGNNSAHALNPWADPNTRIRSAELIRLRQIFKDASGQNAGVAVTEPGIESQLVQNDELRAFVKGRQAELLLKNLELSGINPQWKGLGGLQWGFTDGTYKPEGGQVTRYFPRDTVVVLPPTGRLKNVLGQVEGITHVPRQAAFGPAPKATELLRPMRGSYSYAVLRNDPFGIRIYAGWYGLPVILDPNAVLVYRTGALAGVP